MRGPTALPQETGAANHHPANEEHIRQMNTTTRLAGCERVDHGRHTRKDRGNHNRCALEACPMDKPFAAGLFTLLLVATSLAGRPMAAALQAAEQPLGPATGLRAHPHNPRYFTDGSG